MGDGVRFVLEAEGPAGRQVLLERHLNPRARAEERGWVDVWVDLDHLAGQEVRLVLRTEAGADPHFDWAGWANPQVVRWTGARPHPGTPPVWALTPAPRRRASTPSYSPLAHAGTGCDARGRSRSVSRTVTTGCPHPAQS